MVRVKRRDDICDDKFYYQNKISKYYTKVYVDAIRDLEIEKILEDGVS